MLNMEGEIERKLGTKVVPPSLFMPSGAVSPARYAEANSVLGPLLPGLFCLELVAIFIWPILCP